jgi:CubicO group peptidase (beta-lactamase class C family)
MTRRDRSAWLAGTIALAVSRGASAESEPQALVSPRLGRADAVVQQAIVRGVFPGGALAVGRTSGVVHVRAFGRLSGRSEDGHAAVDTLYDLASLTKVVATTSVAMVLVDQGRLQLDAPVCSWFPEMVDPARKRIRVRDLLAHSSGLPSWRALSREAQDKRGVIERILQLELEYEPGTRSIYSDLGMILLGEVLERVTGEGLDAAAGRLLFRPLGMEDTLFRPGPERRDRTAPTVEDPWRGRLLRGEVQDENAYRMGGVAGHAGLFGTARDLSRFAQMMLAEGQYAGGALVRPSTLALFTRRIDLARSTRTLGWETPSGDSWAGRSWSDRAYGHTGQTGTSIWIDPSRDLYVVLLTNRADLGGRRFDEVRRDVADAVLAALDGPRPAPRSMETRSLVDAAN